MEQNFSEKNLINRNVFKNINFIKGNKINFSYKNTVSNLNKISKKFKDFINCIDRSIENGIDIKGKLYNLNINKNNKPVSLNNSLRIRSKKKLKKISEPEFKTKRVQKIKKNIFKMKGAKSLLEEENKNNILKNYKKNEDELKNKNTNTMGDSIILRKILKKKKNFSKTMRNLSVSNYKIIDDSFNSEENEIINLTNNKNKNKKNNTIIVKEASSLLNSKEETKFSKTSRPKLKDSFIPQNLSLSLYRPNKHYFENYKHKLKPKYLMEFVNKSNKIKKSYEKDFDIVLPNNDKKLLKIAQNEINMKDPEYHRKQIFKNVLYVKQTIRFAKKMRNEHKVKVKYSGLGNIGNESIMRKKNANLIRFCDNICRMTDDKFYGYRKLLNELYPTLTKEVFKEKYQISEKNSFYEMKCNENLMKIKRLFSLMQKPQKFFYSQ